MAVKWLALRGPFTAGSWQALNGRQMATLKRAICDKKWLAMLPFLPFVALTETTNGPFMSCLLGWSTLEDRRREARLTLFYKIVKGEIAVSSEDIHLETADRQTRSTHKFKFKTKSASTSNLSNFVTHKTLRTGTHYTSFCGGCGLKRLLQVSPRTSEAAGYLSHMRLHYPPHRYTILPEEVNQLSYEIERLSNLVPTSASTGTGTST